MTTEIRIMKNNHLTKTIELSDTNFILVANGKIGVEDYRP
jgi:hypothetical protein